MASIEPNLSDDEDDNDEEWEEEKGSSEVVVSPIFSPSVQFSSLSEACEHDKSNFNFDLKMICVDLKLDFYGAVRMVNFLRCLVSQQTTTVSQREATALLEILKSDVKWQTDDTWLKPFLEDDGLLQCIDAFIIEEDWSDDDDDDDACCDKNSSQHEDDNRKTIELELSKVRRQLSDTQAQLALMGRTLLERNDLMTPQASTTITQALPRTIYTPLYFVNDGSLGAYEAAILSQPQRFQGKVVLDIGVSSGILSIFAAQAGALKVIGLGRRNLDRVRSCVVDNGLEEKVCMIDGDQTNSMRDQLGLALGERVDVIMSEWLASSCFLLDSVFTSVINARDEFLSPGGIIIPTRMKLFLSGGVDNEMEILNNHPLKLDNLAPVSHAFSKMGGLQDSVTTKEILLNYDMLSCSSELQLEGTFEIKFLRESIVNCFVLTLLVCPHHDEKHASTSEKQLILPMKSDNVSHSNTHDLITGSYAMYREGSNQSDYQFGVSWAVGNQKRSQSFRISI